MPLLAAGFDWLEGLFGLLVVAFWIVSQVVNLVRRATTQPADRRVEPVAPPRRLPDTDLGLPGDDIRGDLERQIEEFLARSRSGRVEPRAAPPRPPARSSQPRVQPAPRGSTHVASRPRATPGKASAAASSVATRQLDPLGAAGDNVAEHVHDAFKRELSHLASSLPTDGAGEAARGPRVSASPAAAALSQSLRNPEDVRRLILLREVLDRPVERWE